MGINRIGYKVMRALLGRVVVTIPDGSSRILSLQVTNDPSFWTADGEPNKLAQTALSHYAAAFPRLFGALTRALKHKQETEEAKSKCTIQSMSDS